MKAQDSDVSIRHYRLAQSMAGRMALAVLGSVALALVVATLVGLWHEVDRYGLAKREALTTAAGVFASAGASATHANDPVAATETLRAIARQPEFVYAGIERPDGSIFADQGLTIRLDSDLDLSRGYSIIDLLTSRTVQVRVPIRHHGTEIGTVVLVADTSDLAARLSAIVVTSAVGSAFALVLALLVSYGLQRSITQPIAALVATMEQVRLQGDYGHVATVVRNDEVGALARTFNSLLATVRERDDRLARHRDRLEIDVADRTADLLDAKDAAEAANTAKSSFLATMSHEIRTPLNGMLVMAELLAGAELPQRQKRYAEVIARSGQSLLAIINDILDFAKVEAGKIELEHIAVEPGEVVDTVISLFAEKAREKNLDLAAYVSPDVPKRIVGDPVRLGQILGNFINNALKFTESGSVVVRIETTGRALRLMVRDTGIGIPTDKLPTIFSAFSQADQSTTRRFGGTGLGLSIAQRLVEAMGGAIGVDSEVGVGSTFWAEIPLDPAAIEPAARIVRQSHVSAAILVSTSGAATAAVLQERLADAGFLAAAPDDGIMDHWIADAGLIAARGSRAAVSGRVIAIARMGDPAAASVVDAGLADALLRWPVVQEELNDTLAALALGLTGTSEGRRKIVVSDSLPQFATARILVADDSAVNREVLIEALSRFGIADITTVEDGRAAVEACLATDFDLVLMDGSMPILDGYEAASLIRSREQQDGRRRVPIVAATAHVIGTAAVAWKDAGMDGTLTKPFTLSDLGDVLQATLVRETRSSGHDDHSISEPLPIQAFDDLLDEAVIAGLEEMSSNAGGAFARRILMIYAEHAPTAMRELDRSSAAAVAADVARAAHSLKSMSLNVGGRALAARLSVIETAARTGKDLPAPSDISVIDALLTETLAALHSRFREVPEPTSEGSVPERRHAGSSV